jgi:asparagine synthase (glutamine-hydrolysing)
LSGIAAVWRLDGAPLPQVDLDRILERLSPRPEDPGDRWLDGPIGLGQRMLAGSRDAFPATLSRSAEAGDVVVADARLDNRAELVAALGLPLAAAEGFADGELILRAWERWGESCPARLLGDYAFAVWDARRRTLFCARDPAGVKPLYYHAGPRVFAAASGTGALFAAPGVPRRIDELRIAAYLVPGLENRTATFNEGVVRLPPGHCLTVTPTGGVTPRPYWQPDAARELRLGSDAEYAERFRELFTDAVRCRLRGAAPVAAALSGGLDSSSVVCVARAIRTASGAGPLPTYTARFPTIPRCDEGAYVAAVEAGGGLSPRHLDGDALDPLGDLESGTLRYEEALQAGGFYMHWALYRAAAADGMHVFLEGTGGDIVVSHGTGYLGDLARRGRWLELGREARRLSQAFERPTWRVLRTAAVSVAPPAFRRGWRRARRSGLFGPPLIRAEFARRMRLDERLRAAEPARLPREIEGARGEHWRQLTSPRLAGILETLAAAGRVMGVEPRDPFLDRRLIEFCLALPASQKIRHGRTRVVARHALAALLPAEIRDRPGKAPIDLMLSAALAVYGRERLDRLMTEAADSLDPYVGASVVRETYRAYRARGTMREVRQVWRLALLALRLRPAER